MIRRVFLSTIACLFGWAFPEKEKQTGKLLLWNVKDGFGRLLRVCHIPKECATYIEPSPLYPDGAWRIKEFPGWPASYLPGAWAEGGVVVPSKQVIVIPE
jgi:hypothetical protein